MNIIEAVRQSVPSCFAIHPTAGANSLALKIAHPQLCVDMTGLLDSIHGLLLHADEHEALILAGDGTELHLLAGVTPR